MIDDAVVVSGCRSVMSGLELTAKALAQKTGDAMKLSVILHSLDGDDHPIVLRTAHEVNNNDTIEEAVSKLLTSRRYQNVPLGNAKVIHEDWIEIRIAKEKP